MRGCSREGRGAGGDGMSDFERRREGVGGESTVMSGGKGGSVVWRLEGEGGPGEWRRGGGT